MNNSVITRLVATISFIGMILVNALANALPINGLNTGEVSALYPNLFTPASITFSVWSIIYLSLAAFVVYMWIDKSDNTIRKVLPWFIVSCIINASWILVWHHLFVGLSVLLMLCLLATLIKIFLIMTPGKKSLKEHFLINVPFILYFAWISVATIANISAFLVAIDWNGGILSPEVWTIIMMVIATALGIFITFRYKTPAYTLVIIWALMGIFIRWRTSEETMIIYASVGLVLILLVSLVMLRRKQVSH